MRKHSAIYLQFVLFLATHDPSFALRLWVYQKRIPCCLGDDDTVLNGQLIAWESMKIPFTNLKKIRVKLIPHYNFDQARRSHKTNQYLSLFTQNFERLRG